MDDFFQIDKYIKVADSGTIPENDPMHFKPNLDALNRDSDENSDEADGDEEAGTGEKKYVVPKHVPAYFNQDENPESLEREREEKIKKRILSRGLIDDLKRQHLDTPEEVFDAETSKQSRQVAYERERTRLVLLRSLGLLDMYVSLPILSHLITVCWFIVDLVIISIKNILNFTFLAILCREGVL